MSVFNYQVPEKITLTKRQYQRIGSLIGNGIFSINYSGKTDLWTIESTRQLSQEEISAFVSSMKALSDDPLPEELMEEDYKSHPFFSMTPDQAEAHIQTAVTDLASAKAALKVMARLLIHLNRKTKRGLS